MRCCSSADSISTCLGGIVRWRRVSELKKEGERRERRNGEEKLEDNFDSRAAMRGDTRTLVPVDVRGPWIGDTKSGD